MLIYYNIIQQFADEIKQERSKFINRMLISAFRFLLSFYLLICVIYVIICNFDAMNEA